MAITHVIGVKVFHKINRILPQNGVGFPYYTTEICLDMQAEQLTENLSNRDGKESFLFSKIRTSNVLKMNENW